MPIIVIIVLFFLSFAGLIVSAIAALYKVDSSATMVAFIVSVVMVLVTASLCKAYDAFGEVKVIHTDDPSQHTYQLVKTSFDDHEFYLYGDADGFHYVYLDGDKVESQSAPQDQITIQYTSDQPCVVVTQTTLVKRKEWWVFYDQDEQEISAQYEFHLPSRDYIKFSFENS